jgi:hypothetical protein
VIVNIDFDPTVGGRPKPLLTKVVSRSQTAVGENPVRLALVFLLLALPSGVEAACKQIKAESDVIGIRIGDAQSAVRVIGAASFPGAEQDKNKAGADTSFPYVRFASRDGREELKLYEHYGDEANSYNEIEVAPAHAGVSAAKRLPVTNFSTERGIKLGITERALIRTLGSCFKRRSGSAGETVIEYAIDDPSHALLRRANMPSYYAHYVFRRGKLARFKFGFEYP